MQEDEANALPASGYAARRKAKHKQVPDAQEDSGLESLRALREARSVSLQSIAAFTHIPVAQLQALEEGRIEHFASPSIAAGFLRQYCLFLGVDSVPYVRHFCSEAQKNRQPSLRMRPGNGFGKHVSLLYLVASFLLVAFLGWTVWEKTRGYKEGRVSEVARLASDFAEGNAPPLAKEGGEAASVFGEILAITPWYDGMEALDLARPVKDITCPEEKPQRVAMPFRITASGKVLPLKLDEKDEICLSLTVKDAMIRWHFSVPEQLYAKTVRGRVFTAVIGFTPAQEKMVAPEQSMTRAKNPLQQERGIDENPV